LSNEISDLLKSVEYHEHLEDWDNALTTLDILEKKDPTNVGLYMCEKAKIYAKQNHLKKAITCFDKSLKSSKATKIKVEVLMRKAEFLEKHHTISEAAECYDEVLKLKPDFDDAKKNRERINRLLSMLLPDAAELLCIDPSYFLSYSSIDGLVKILLILGKEDKIVGRLSYSWHPAGYFLPIKYNVVHFTE
jgi:tetratricopeptide (TPR) repeat protein